MMLNEHISSHSSNETEYDYLLYAHERNNFDIIHEDLFHMLKNQAMTYSIMINYARNTRFDPKNDIIPSELVDRRHISLDQAILTALTECQLSSIRELFR
jgi:hypothetical protein